MIPDIKINRKWSIDSVMKVCIANNLYTCGTNTEYNEILTFVKSNKPTYENIFKVASNILNHSEGQTVTNIMFLIENYAVIKTFTVNGRDDI